MLTLWYFLHTLIPPYRKFSFTLRRNNEDMKEQVAMMERRSNLMQAEVEESREELSRSCWPPTRERAAASLAGENRPAF